LNLPPTLDHLGPESEGFAPQADQGHSPQYKKTDFAGQIRVGRISE